MTTSATLPSTTGSVVHGGFSTMIEEEDTVTTNDGDEFEVPLHPRKRFTTTSLADTCKKRRKQSTPVRISASDTEFGLPPEGKNSNPSPEPEFPCPLCHELFNKLDRLEAHLMEDHGRMMYKKDLDERYGLNSTLPINFEHPLEMPPTSRNQLTWISDLQGKEWMNPHLHGVPFTTATSLFMSLPPFSNPESIPNRHQIRIFNPDAFCNICNKEFCNKYFLKTHKANKHGVYSPPFLITDPLTASVSIPSRNSYLKVPIMNSNIPLSVIKSDIKLSDIISTTPIQFSNKLFSKLAKSSMQSLFQSETSEGIPSEVNVPPVMPCNGQNEQLPEETPPEDALLNSPKSNQHDYITMKTEFNIDQDSNYFNPNKMSLTQAVRDYDLKSLRRLGVMNPKAFCEICCKEYCNKYFLRTHKYKRHGIFIPDDKDKDTKSDSWSPHKIQTSPLNLIVTDQTISSSSGRKTTSPADISCDTCGIKFQNVALAHLHNVSVHSKIPIESIDSNINLLTSSSAELLTGNEKNVNATDAISEDLQKLQTMILQLNDLDVSKVNTVCNVCAKEFDNRYYLHAHMMTEHGLLVEETSDVEKPIDPDAIIMPTHFTCELCNKECINADEMKKHLNEAHHGQSNTEGKEEYLTNIEKSANRISNTSGQFPERRHSSGLAPSSSYCEICNKELCNKYFMKTHMQRMHGIEIENGAQIGGVVCDICNKELCSKYFLRVHKHNTHGIVEYASNLIPTRKSDGESPAMLPTEPDPSLKPGDLADLSHRYFTHFTEVCSICSRRFRSTKWLKAHLLSDHGQIGAEKWAELEQQLQQSIGQNVKAGNSSKSSSSQSGQSSPTLKIPNGNQIQDNAQKVNIQNVLSSIFGADETIPKNYHCSYCPFQTPVLPFLFVHERSHTIPQSENDNVHLKCPVCSQNFPQPELLQHHLFTQHPFFPLPPFFNGNSETQRESCGREVGEINEDPKVDHGGSPLDSVKQHLQQSLPIQPPQPPPPPPPPPGAHRSKKSKRRSNKSVELSPEVNHSLKEVAKRSQLPATYALPQLTENYPLPLGYTMQAFLLDQEPGVERRFVPSVVFLPVLQKQLTPVTLAFTLTPT